MKLLLVLMFCVLAVATSAHDTVLDSQTKNVEHKNILVDILVRQFFAYIRRIIKKGSNIFGTPRLDPLDLENYHLMIPAGLINLDMELTNAVMNGLGNFVVHTGKLRLPELTFDLDISVTRLHIRSELYNLTGDFLTALPIYGKGKVEFLTDFRFTAKLYLKRSDDLRSVIIDKIENASFAIPHFKSKIEGAMGGGEIDNVVNAITEEVLIGYVNRFQGTISTLASHAWIKIGNALLEQYNSWRFIAPFL